MWLNSALAPHHSLHLLPFPSACSLDEVCSVLVEVMVCCTLLVYADDSEGRVLGVLLVILENEFCAGLP